MGLPRPELAGREETCTTAGREMGKEFTTGNWQVGRWEEELSTGDGTSKVGTGRQGDGKRNLPQEMGHPRETNLPHDMGLPRPELAGRETGRCYRGGWGIQGGKWQEFTPAGGNWQAGRREEEFYHRRWDT